MDRSHLALLAALAVLGVALTATVIPGAFTMDEDNHLVGVLGVRQGRLSVPGTEGLPPTNELLWFDPIDRWRTVEATPVVSQAPPLYGVLAAPFAGLGWRGLVALNTLAYLVATWLVFAHVRRHASGPLPPWLGAGAFALGAYAIEYAQGTWPHMLAVALVTGAFVLAGRVRDGGPLGLAVLAGALAGIAGGVRYQDLFAAACIGAGLLLVPGRRWRALAAYAGGAALPVAAATVLNRLRAPDVAGPVAKGGGYLAVSSAGQGSGSPWLDAPWVVWSKVVDFAAHPPLTGVMAEVHTYLSKDPTTGAFVVFPGALKKAWLQSAPWAALALVTAAVACARWRRETSPAGRELRAVALVLFPVIAAFGVAGFARMDGVSYNQRYFHELVPLAAIALALAVDAVDLDRRALLAGLLAGLSGVLAIDRFAEGVARHGLLLDLPVALAALTALAWVAARHVGQVERNAAVALALGVGVTLSWGLGVHLADDLPASRTVRDMHLRHARAIEPLLGERSAIVAWSGRKIGFGPLLLDHDVVIADPAADGAKAAPALIAALHDAGRTVFLVESGMPPPVVEALSRAYEVDRRELPLGEGFDPLVVRRLTRP